MGKNARTYRTFPREKIFPFPFDIAQRFCYFYDLYSQEYSGQKVYAGKNGRAIPNGGRAKVKRELYQHAMDNLTTPIQNALTVKNDEKNVKIESALKFLAQAAEVERNKEVRAVTQYIKSLRQKPAIWNSLDPQVQDTLSYLEAFQDNPEQGLPKDFYAKLTLGINMAKKSFEEYNKRLDQLKDAANKTQQDIRSDFTKTRLPTDIDTLIKSILGIRQRASKDSLTTKIIKLLFNYANTYLSKYSQAFIDNPIEVLVGLMIAFEEYIYKTRTIPLGVNLEDITEEKMGELFADFIGNPKDDIFLTALNEQSEQLYDILSGLSDMIDLRNIVDKKQLEERNKILKKNTRNEAKGKKNNSIELNTLGKNTKAILEKNLGNHGISNKMTWNITTPFNNRHGIIYEYINTVLDNALKIKGSAAADILSLGKIDLTIHDQEDYDISYQALKDIKYEIEKYATIQRKDRLDDIQDQYTIMNRHILTISEKVNEWMRQNDIQEDLFIYHESLKLYTQIETHQTHSFEGRNILILNALDQIYSTSELIDIELVNKDVMYGIALNLSSLSLGHNDGVKNIVENYLSIFAGLLMFDDIYNVANEVINYTDSKIQPASLRQVHLYLVNDIYVPASMILYKVSQALITGYAHISSQHAARITIDTNDADKVITEYLESHYGEEEESAEYSLSDWEPTANDISSGTKIDIIFLSSFFSFLTELRNQLP